MFGYYITLRERASAIERDRCVPKSVSDGFAWVGHFSALQSAKQVDAAFV